MFGAEQRRKNLYETSKHKQSIKVFCLGFFVPSWNMRSICTVRDTQHTTTKKEKNASVKRRKKRQNENSRLVFPPLHHRGNISYMTAINNFFSSRFGINKHTITPESDNVASLVGLWTNLTHFEWHQQATAEFLIKKSANYEAASLYFVRKTRKLSHQIEGAKKLPQQIKFHRFFVIVPRPVPYRFASQFFFDILLKLCIATSASGDEMRLNASNLSVNIQN